jgi:putative serine protease PepD
MTETPRPQNTPDPVRVPAFAGASTRHADDAGWRSDPMGPTTPPPQGWGPTPEQPPRPRRTLRGIVAAAVIGGLVGGAGGFGGAYALVNAEDNGANALRLAPASPVATATGGSVAAAAATVLPSTVDIRVTLAGGAAEGSGVVLTADGDVLTNNHVVDGARTITVTLADGSQHQATVVGTSPSYDLAVIKLQGVSGLTPATLGTSANLQVGQEVVAIGSPQGLSGTVTSGIISALNRTVAVQGEDGSAVVYNGLQTDASINPGNSGGPLIDLNGHVIGIDSAAATAGGANGGQGGSVGLGFAIPIDQATRIAQELMSTGTATKPTLGVQGSAQAATEDGAQIAAVVPDSPAAQAGLAAGDVVTGVDGTQVEDFTDLIARVGAHAPGDQVTLTLTGGRTVTVTLGSTPDTAATTTARPSGN